MTVMPSSVGQLRLELRVDEALERDRDELLALLAMTASGPRPAPWVRRPGDGLGADPALGLVQAPRLDRDAVAELVLGDRLAVDAADRREVVVVPGQARGVEEDDDGGDDDQAEAEVEVEVAPVPALPRGRSGGA